MKLISEKNPKKIGLRLAKITVMLMAFDFRMISELHGIPSS